MKKIFLLIFCLICFQSSFSKVRNALELSLLSGAQVGWWNHIKGKDADGLNLGWDRSHTTAQIPFEIQVWENITPKWSLGISGNYSIFFDDYLVSSDNTRRNGNITTFSDKEYVTHWSVQLKGRYALFHNSSFKLGPVAGMGYGNVQSTHPDQNRFLKNIAVSGAFFVHWHFNPKLALIFQPSYNALFLLPENRRKGEHHRLTFFGAKFGITWLL